VSHIRGPRMNYRLKYWLSTEGLSVRPFIASDEVSWGQLTLTTRISGGGKMGHDIKSLTSSLTTAWAFT